MADNKPVTRSDAKELTPKQLEARQERCFKLNERIKSSIAKGREAMWKTAEYLVKFDEEAGWSALGYENLSSWLADPEIEMSRATYYRATRAYREMVVVRNLDVSTLGKLDLSKVDIVLPQITKGKITAEEGLADAEVLGARDLREKYIDANYQPDPEPDDEPKSATVDETGVTADVIDGREHPSSDAWDELVERAKRRKRPLVKYIEKMTEWERVPDTDGKEREHWHLPSPLSASEGTDDADTSEPPEEGTEAVSEPQGARGAIDQEMERIAVLDQGLEDWAALRDDLIEAAESGSAKPRVDVRLIRPGVQGVQLLMDDWRKLRNAERNQ